MDNRKVHALAETKEGTLFYVDDQAVPQPKRALAFLVVALVLDDVTGETQIAAKSMGTAGMIAESLARWFTLTPGMMDAVGGMLSHEAKRLAATIAAAEQKK